MLKATYLVSPLKLVNFQIFTEANTCQLSSSMTLQFNTMNIVLILINAPVSNKSTPSPCLFFFKKK